MATKHDKVVTYCEGLPHINSHISKMQSLRSCNNLKTISLLSQCMWSPNLSGWFHTARRSQPYISMTHQWGCFMSSRDKVSTYPHYHNAYGHKTFQGDSIPWRTLTHKFAWPFYYMIIVRSNDNLKILHLYFHRTYGH